jgi:hypothetical protein
VACQAAMRLEAKVIDLVQRIRDGQVQVGYSVVGRSRGWLTLSVICIVHRKMKSIGFLV